jgi:hypothetical protein
MPDEGNWLLSCAICKESVNLEESKTDEYGHAVHENCYVSSVKLKKPPRRTDTVHEWPSTLSGGASERLRS